MNRRAIAFVCTFIFSLVFAGEIDIAREALRDGLWKIARAHASKIEGDEAKKIILESYCREEKWEDALKSFQMWTLEPTVDFAYYHALILFKTGNSIECNRILEATDFSNSEFNILSARLKVQVAVADKDFSKALKLVKEFSLDKADVESRMIAADVFVASDSQVKAEQIWLEIASMTNVNEKVFTMAAVNLSNKALLLKAYNTAKDVKLRRFAGAKLGTLLLDNQETFLEGKSLIRALAKDSPDADGVQDAFVTLGDFILAQKKYQEAADTFAEAIEIWPVLSFNSKVQEGRGWAFYMLGQTDEALDAFMRAEETAKDDDSRATAILEQGDVLSSCGRGEEALAKYRIVLDKYSKTLAGEKLKVIVELREFESKGCDLYKNYDFAGAQKIFNLIAKKDPMRKARMDYYGVLCFYGQGMDREAQESARNLLSSTTDETIKGDVTFWLAKFSYNRRRWKEAKNLFEEYVKLRPKSKDAPFALLWSAKSSFADNDFEGTIKQVAELSTKYSSSPEKLLGFLVQGEALIELARFDEAILVFDRMIASSEIPAEEKFKAQVLRADALFAMGADNPSRYEAALQAYQALRLSEALSPSMKISVAFKIGRTLEKLKRIDEAMDLYYTAVVLSYREGRMKGMKYNDEARACFSRAAFRLADEYESRGKEFQAMHILELVVASDVPSSAEAEKRIDRIQMKGKFL